MSYKYHWNWNTYYRAGSPWENEYAPYRIGMRISGIQKGGLWQSYMGEPLDGWYDLVILAALYDTQSKVYQGQMVSYITSTFDFDLYRNYPYKQFQGSMQWDDGWQLVNNELTWQPYFNSGSVDIDLHLRGFVEQPFWDDAYLLRLDRAGVTYMEDYESNNYKRSHRYCRRRDKSNLRIYSDVDLPVEFVDRHGPPLNRTPAVVARNQ